MYIIGMLDSLSYHCSTFSEWTWRVKRNNSRIGFFRCFPIWAHDRAGWKEKKPRSVHYSGSGRLSLLFFDTVHHHQSKTT